jgi:pimeloyl-ACP methyl ester carboxylesterase
VATFVLIPGAGTDPRVYDATIEELHALGHEAVAPALPLDDPEAHPSDHAAAVAEATPKGGELVVAGQSLGAFAAPLVAELTGAQLLVLVAPMIPAPGETAGEWWAATGHADAIAELIARRGRMGEWQQETFEEVFLHDVEPRVVRASAGYNRVPGPGMFTEPWPLARWPDVHTRVLAPRDDRLFPLEFQKRVARERLGIEVDEIPGGHLPMLSRPAELARRLVELFTAPS